MYNIKDNVVLVTGGAAGIGAGIVKAFLEGGAKHVAALDIDVVKGMAFENDQALIHGSDRIKFYKCDVTTNELDACYDNIIKKYGYIDVVVNNAGIMNDSPNVYLKEIEINVTALIKSSLKAYELIRKDRGGRGGAIINISSIVGISRVATLPVYTATKSAVLQFSNCLGMNHHYNRSDVRVITICFGCTDTTLFSNTKMGAIDKETESLLEPGYKNLPMQTLESAVKGLIYAYQHGASASTWLVTSNRPAEDITNNVTKAYEVMGQGILL
ncbi:hypothetical protein K1T71_003760 [Dendrolimus kikuchii]|uniref:Uncharacterized protein n=1 Tax=Dendrolimus kikuchii TaxID=765133 RepID=A0ACC1D8Z1_9NEOP|nr:hypothetical protein K1T71_003760 [Dendrolimus kikuchii]